MKTKGSGSSSEKQLSLMLHKNENEAIEFLHMFYFSIFSPVLIALFNSYLKSTPLMDGIHKFCSLTENS